MTSIEIYKDPLPDISERQTLFEEDAGFWTTKMGIDSKDLPEIIVACTGSIRKWIMFEMWAKRSGLLPLKSGDIANSWNEVLGELPDYVENQLQERGVLEQYRKRISEIQQLAEKDKPLALQQAFKEFIPNGNGSLKVGSRVRVGVIHGIEIFIQSGDGETDDNNEPAKESLLKINDVKKDPDFNDRKVLFIGMDTIGQPAAGIRASKPAEDKPYKEYSSKPESEKREDWVQYYAVWYLLSTYLGLIDETFEDWLAQNSTIDAAKTFAIQQIIQGSEGKIFSERHIVGIAMVLGETQFLTHIYSVIKIHEMFEDLIEMDFDTQAGLGGFFQQIYFRYLDQIDFRSQVISLLRNAVREGVGGVNETDIQWSMLFTIMGMPSVLFPSLLRHLGRKVRQSKVVVGEN